MVYTKGTLTSGTYKLLATATATNPITLTFQEGWFVRTDVLLETALTGQQQSGYFTMIEGEVCKLVDMNGDALPAHVLYVEVDANRIVAEEEQLITTLTTISPPSGTIVKIYQIEAGPPPVLPIVIAGILGAIVLYVFFKK